MSPSSLSDLISIVSWARICLRVIQILNTVCIFISGVIADLLCWKLVASILILHLKKQKEKSTNSYLIVKQNFTDNILVNTVRMTVIENGCTWIAVTEFLILALLIPLFILLFDVASWIVCVSESCIKMHAPLDKSHLYPIFGVNQKHAAAFTPSAHRLDHQLSQQKPLMGHWKMNNSSWLGCICLVFLCRLMSCCPPWLYYNSWVKLSTTDDDHVVAGCNSILYGVGYRVRPRV